MEKEIIIAGISGSLRKGSYNTKLLKAAAGLLPDGVKLKMISIADIPLYNGDNDLPIANQRPESVERFRTELASADGLLIATPEYNHSIPGVLKNALDWASRGNDSPLLNKPVAMIGASMGMFGTARSQNAMLSVFQTLNMKFSAQPEVLVGKAQDKFDENDMIAEEVIIKLLRGNLDGLINTIRKYW